LHEWLKSRSVSAVKKSTQPEGEHKKGVGKNRYKPQWVNFAISIPQLKILQHKATTMATLHGLEE